MDWAQLDAVVDAGLHCGAADAEAVFYQERDLDIEVAKGEVETLAQSESIGLGVRLFTADRRLGFAYTTERHDPAGVAQKAWQNAQAGAPDAHNVLPEEHAASDDDGLRQDFAGVAAADKIALAKDLEQRVLSADARIRDVHDASYGDVSYAMTLVNSRGLRRRYRSGYCTCSVTAAAEQDGCDDEMGFEFDFARAFQDLRTAWTAAECARRTVERLGGKPCATKTMPVVFENRVATSILGVIAPGLNAENVLKNKSLFRDDAGQTVAAACVSIRDRNDLPEGMNWAPFDGEGVSAQETALVTDGVLEGFMHNAYTAHRMGARSTANAGRAGYHWPPHVGPTNLYLAPGGAPLETLFEQAGTGLFVQQAMGVHTANPISGDFSFGVAGRLIEGGRLGRPVREVAIAGNIKQLLQRVAALGADLRFFGACGAPAMLVSELMVSGE